MAGRLELAAWRALQYQTGTGVVRAQHDGVKLAIGPDDGKAYSDAQLDDYHDHGVLRWRPPLRLDIRARFSHPAALLRGTAGFGFWNDPFGMTRVASSLRGWPRLHLPQVVWFFFAAPPANMPLARDVAGHGWKAAMLDASGGLARLLLPLAPLGMLLCRWPWGYRHLWPLVQHLLKIDEAIISAAMDEWHAYTIEWDTHAVRCLVDGQVVLQAPFAPRGPLGLVIWVDNQYMVATPQGVFRHGVVSTDTQWMEIAALEVAPLS